MRTMEKFGNGFGRECFELCNQCGAETVSSLKPGNAAGARYCSVKPSHHRTYLNQRQPCHSHFFQTFSCLIIVRVNLPHRSQESGPVVVLLCWRRWMFTSYSLTRMRKW